MRAILPVVLTVAMSASGAPQLTVAPSANKPLTNENIVTLRKAGFDELFILQLIHHSPTHFDTGVEATVTMKESGISENLIQSMLSPEASSPAAAGSINEIAAGSSFRVAYDGGSLPNIKAGAGLRLYIDSNQLRLEKDETNVVTIPASAVAETVTVRTFIDESVVPSVLPSSRSGLEQ